MARCVSSQYWYRFAHITDDLIHIPLLAFVFHSGKLVLYGNEIYSASNWQVCGNVYTSPHRLPYVLVCWSFTDHSTWFISFEMWSWVLERRARCTDISNHQVLLLTKWSRAETKLNRTERAILRIREHCSRSRTILTGWETSLEFVIIQGEAESEASNVWVVRGSPGSCNEQRATTNPSSHCLAKSTLELSLPFSVITIGAKVWCCYVSWTLPHEPTNSTINHYFLLSIFSDLLLQFTLGMDGIFVLSILIEQCCRQLVNQTSTTHSIVSI